MKKVFTLLAIVMSLSVCSQEMTFMSYNIRYANKGDNENSWDQRKEEVVSLIQSQKPTAFGVQEALLKQVTYLDSLLTEYGYIGVGREDGRKKGEFSAIFYNKKLLRVFDASTFWLSLTPDHVSTGWDAALPRICTIAKFEHRDSKNQFFFLNTHFDHRGNTARFQSSLLISKKLRQLNIEKLPVVLTGDFNAKPSQRPILVFSDILNDASKISESPLVGPIGTFSGFDPNARLRDRIDYIFVKGMKVKSYAHLDNKRKNGLWPSDHLPVLIEASFR